MSPRFAILGFSTVLLTALPLAASADAGDVSVVNAQFTNKIEGGKPVGDAASVTSGQPATYWVEVKNAKEPTQITLVWKVDGAVAGKQTLDVGQSPRWRTWGSWPTRSAEGLEVHVLDKDGAELRSDALTLSKSAVPKA